MKLLAALVFLVLVSSLVVAGSASFLEQVKTQYGDILYLVLILAAWSGTAFFVWMAFSCHHFRFFSARKIQKRPPACGVECEDKTCEKELPARQAHRFAFYGAGLSFLVHFSLVFYLGRLAYQPPLFVMNALLLLVAFTLWFFSCHFLKYKLGRIARSKNPKSLLGKVVWESYNAIKLLNEYHGVFMWLAFLFLFLHLFLRFIIPL